MHFPDPKHFSNVLQNSRLIAPQLYINNDSNTSAHRPTEPLPYIKIQPFLRGSRCCTCSVTQRRVLAPFQAFSNTSVPYLLQKPKLCGNWEWIKASHGETAGRSDVEKKMEIGLVRWDFEIKARKINIESVSRCFWVEIGEFNAVGFTHCLRAVGLEEE